MKPRVVEKERMSAMADGVVPRGVNPDGPDRRIFNKSCHRSLMAQFLFGNCREMNMSHLMRVLAAAFVGLALLGPASAQEPAGADEARAIVQSQLNAFQNEAVDEAYGFAAPNIRRMFPTPEVFGRMVREGYPMVWNPADTEFLQAFPRGAMIVQRLRIVDQKGVPYIAEYALMKVDGEWRIAGVEIKKDKSYGA